MEKYTEIVKDHDTGEYSKTTIFIEDGEVVRVTGCAFVKAPPDNELIKFGPIDSSLDNPKIEIVSEKDDRRFRYP